MSIENRRFPRFDLSGSGRVRTHGQSSRDLEVAVETLSARGAGVRLMSGEGLCPGRSVELSFALDGQDFVCEAHVVWAAAGQAGMRLRTGAMSEEQKRHFARWLVPRIKKSLAAA
jgi:hypothetical protein